jgi:hypothetical protein
VNRTRRQSPPGERERHVDGQPHRSKCGEPGTRAIRDVTGRRQRAFGCAPDRRWIHLTAGCDLDQVEGVSRGCVCPLSEFTSFPIGLTIDQFRCLRPWTIWLMKQRGRRPRAYKRIDPSDVPMAENQSRSSSPFSVSKATG